MKKKYIHVYLIQKYIKVSVYTSTIYYKIQIYKYIYIYIYIYSICIHIYNIYIIYDIYIYIILNLKMNLNIEFKDGKCWWMLLVNYKDESTRNVSEYYML